jgi:hypothetical protein
MQHQTSGLGVADGFDAEQVAHLSFEPTGRETKVRQRR